MKDIDKLDHPDVSGGYSPGDDGCIPRFPISVGYPQEPTVPLPEPLAGPLDPQPDASVK